MEYHLLTLVCHLSIFALAVLFLWSSVSTFINKHPQSLNPGFAPASSMMILILLSLVIAFDHHWNKINIIMLEAASFFLKHGRKQEAASLYEQLVKSGSTDALCGLIKIAAETDLDKVEAYKKQLKPLPGLKSVNVDALEKTSGAKSVEDGATVSITETYETKNKDRKKKRKRKPRYPKGFDPANPGPPPDLERWLPRRERSSYRPKRKDKRAAQIRGSQGAVVKDNAGGSSKNTQATDTKGTSNSVSAEHSKPLAKSSKKKSRK